MLKSAKHEQHKTVNTAQVFLILHKFECLTKNSGLAAASITMLIVTTRFKGVENLNIIDLQIFFRWLLVATGHKL